MDLEEIGISAGNWVDSAQDRNYWRACECSIEPPGSISYGVSYVYIGVTLLLWFIGLTFLRIYLSS